MNHALGHRLRDGALPSVGATRRCGILIVGAGISGLSAGWWLARAGRDDFTILELEAEPGGNSRGGQGPQLAYPWGAHYLPLPGPEAVLVRELLAELGVLQGSPAAQRPIYDERYLCATPQERIYRNGLWEEGLLPQRGLDAAELAQQKRFHDRMAELKQATGQDGRRLFAIPMAFFAFRLNGAYFAIGTWVVADIARLGISQWKALGGGTGTSLPKGTTKDMWGVEGIKDALDVSSAAAADALTYWLMLSLALVLLVSSYVFLRSRMGLGLQAIRDNENAARSVGVDPTRLKAMVFLLTAFGTGLCGALAYTSVP